MLWEAQWTSYSGYRWIPQKSVWCWLKAKTPTGPQSTKTTSTPTPLTRTTRPPLAPAVRCCRPSWAPEKALPRVGTRWHRPGWCGATPSRPPRCATRWPPTRSRTSCWCRRLSRRPRWPKLSGTKLVAAASRCCSLSRTARPWASSTPTTSPSLWCPRNYWTFPGSPASLQPALTPTLLPTWLTWSRAVTRFRRVPRTSSSSATASTLPGSSRRWRP